MSVLLLLEALLPVDAIASKRGNNYKILFHFMREYQPFPNDLIGTPFDGTLPYFSI
jgi:hypothetical protein